MDFFSGPHLFIFLIIVLLIFGPKNLPRLAQSLGQSVRELKKGLSGLGDDLKDQAQAPPPPQQPTSGPVPGTQPQNPQFSQPASSAAEPAEAAKNA